MPGLPFYFGFKVIDLLTEDEFGFWVPVDLIKSGKESKDGKRWIEGIASTDNEDLQSEIVKQNGIDTSYFLKYGYFNNDHKPGFSNKVGEPTECKVTPKGLYVKGFLFKDKKVADEIWEMLQSLETSQSTRKLGFSIQGKVLRRAGKLILKCWIQDIAITPAPINTHTWIDVVKSLNSLPSEVWCDESGCYSITPEDAYKSIGASLTKGCGGCTSCPSKSLSEEDMDLKKDEDKDDKEKAFSAGGQSGRALTPESLEGNVKDQNYGHVDETKKSMTFDQSVAWLQAYRNLESPEASIVARAIFSMNGIHQ